MLNDRVVLNCGFCMVSLDTFIDIVTLSLKYCCPSVVLCTFLPDIDLVWMYVYWLKNKLLPTVSKLT